MSTQTPSQKRTLEDIHSNSLELARSSAAIIPFMDEEVVRLEEESASFEAGEQDNATFTPFRLRQGVYGQRQADVQMIRVKIPGGILTPEAMDGLGEISEKFAPLGRGHITTRENIQFHHIPLAECPDVLRLLGGVGLSTREACGNTVRNVVGSPYAGVDPEEVFDPTPYLAAYVRFGVRHPITQGFPRKFKSAFTGTDVRDHVSAAIQDLTYVSQARVVDGVEQKGFKVFVGGGTSIMPRLAKPLYEFVPVDDYLRVALAIWTVFNNADMLRKNRMMARLKVLIDRIGLDEFRTMVDAELEQIGPIDPTPYMEIDELLQETPPVAPAPNGVGASEEFRKWRETNAEAQRQGGFYAVMVKPERGNLDASQFHARWQTSCGATPAAGPGPPRSRTWCSGTFPRATSTTSGKSWTASGWPKPTPAPSPTWSPAPAPTAASSASRRPWAWPEHCGTRWKTGTGSCWTTRA